MLERVAECDLRSVYLRLRAARRRDLMENMLELAVKVLGLDLFGKM